MPDHLHPRAFGKGAGLAALFALALSPTTAQAQRVPGGGLLGRYSEERMTPTRWAISVTRNNAQRARDIVLYRGAVLARAGGFSHVQLVALRVDGINWTSSYRGVPMSTTRIRTAIAQIELVNDQAAPLRCETSVAGSPLCVTLAVDEVFAEIAPRVGRTDPAEIEADVAAAVVRNQRTGARVR